MAASHLVHSERKGRVARQAAEIHRPIAAVGDALDDRQVIQHNEKPVVLRSVVQVVKLASANNATFSMSGQPARGKRIS